MASRTSDRTGPAGAARLAAAAVAGVAIGLAVGLPIGRGGDPEPPPGAASADDASQADLRETLDQERLARAALEAEIALLRSALSDLEDAEATPETQADDALADPDAEPAEGGFDVAALRALGLLPGEIARLRERYERFELDRLYLENTARREGWRNRARFRQERRELWGGLRADLSDPDYDALLYASGRKNRVIVSDVLANSAAEAAGLLPGDELHSYDGERVFDALSLVRATAGGRAGADTEMRVRRGNEEIRVFVPRGPLGLRLSRERRPPDSGW